jgi:hypothetical protein
LLIGLEYVLSEVVVHCLSIAGYLLEELTASRLIRPIMLIL